MITTPPLGLRDRKRIETRARLEHAAVRVVLDHGLEHATVDAISEAADVSPRTFFNYFETKEDAILGLGDIDFDDELVAAHTGDDGRDLIESVVALMIAMMAPMLKDSELKRSRKEILQKYPQLLGRHMTQVTRMTEFLTGAVTPLINRTSGDTSDSAPSPLAEPILGLCMSCVRVAVREWVAAGSDGPSEHIHTRATALAREAAARLQ